MCIVYHWCCSDVDSEHYIAKNMIVLVQKVYEEKVDYGKYNIYIIESVDSISKDERGFPLTQYITNGRISRGGYTFTHFKHHHRVLRLISYSMSV